MTTSKKKEQRLIQNKNKLTTQSFWSQLGSDWMKRQCEFFKPITNGSSLLLAPVVWRAENAILWVNLIWWIAQYAPWTLVRWMPLDSVIRPSNCGFQYYLTQVHHNTLVDFLPQMGSENLNEWDLQCWNLAMHKYSCQVKLHLETNINLKRKKKKK